MKTQLNETGQPLHGFILYGLCDENVDFLNVIMFCANLEVYRPPEPLCPPRLREVATTLAAMRRQRGRENAPRVEYNPTTHRKLITC